ncbi:hypothetical protein CEUSTIGMA_g9938.t1 [Chlamydomonas eustigma]|uniref:Timeless N-terminal domain-containing protein n=1 Tax=Chlamydomonas eustigma TaxID=1157962 RepID=A0A250XHG4_9CHLO|nr:hypothetical protein CEUSTIGMA_g9938.t1 [Chlamydomonas eustigma]|eukprot:GAX82511.1 hypothetical protein CEUSTIGMA_g9938.t1 [Chlamydomonas eustigma]
MSPVIGGGKPALDFDLLVSVSSDIGGYVFSDNGDKTYYKSDDCLGCLKDLQRFMRHDDPDTRPVFFKLANFQTARSDLVPLILTYPDEREIVFNALKVLTFLTMPVDPTSSDVIGQLGHQRSIKYLFTKSEVVAVIVSLVAEPLAKHPRMSQQDSATVQLVVTFFRNLLQIPDDIQHHPGNGAGSMSRILQGSLLKVLFEENVMEMFLIIMQHATERPFRNELSLLLSLQSAIFAGIQPTDLAIADQPFLRLQQHTDTSFTAQGQGTVKQPIERSKKDVLLQEALNQRKQQVAHALAQGPRTHSRARACFVRTHSDTVDRVTFLGNRFDTAGIKAAAAPPAFATSNTEIVGKVGKFSDDVMWRLRCWLEDLLMGGYNVLMPAVRKELEPGIGLSKLTAKDFHNFLSLSWVITGYVRMTKQGHPQVSPLTANAREEKEDQTSSEHVNAVSPFACISSTMGWDTFHLVHKLWLSQLDVPARSDTKDWNIQHGSMALLKEMLMVLDAAQHGGSIDDRNAADRLQRRLLHDDMKESGLLPVLGRLMRDYNPKQQPRQYATDVMQACHVVLKMYDRLNKANTGGFLVKRKKVATRPKPVKGLEASDQELEPGRDQHEKNNEHVNGNNEREDQASHQEGERYEGIERNEHQEGLNDEEATKKTVAREKAPLEELYPEDSEEESDDEDGEGRSSRYREVALNVEALMRRELATPAAVHFLVEQGLRHYAANSYSTNASVCALLDRIASPQSSGGLGLEPMLYQLSVLRVFHALLVDRTIRSKGKISAYAGLLKFATKVLRGLFSKLVPQISKEAPKISTVHTYNGVESRTEEVAQEHIAADKQNNANLGMAAEADSDVHSAPAVPSIGDKQEVEKVKKETEIQHHITGMLFVDLMFWKTATVVDEIKGDYFLRLCEEVGLPGPSQPRRRQGGAADLGDDEQQEQGRHDQVPTGGRAEAEGVNSTKLNRGLSEAKEQLRKLHLKRSRPVVEASAKSILNVEGQQKLQVLFEQYNCSRANMDVVLAGMEGGIKEEQLSKELKCLGLRWGHLTNKQIITLKALWQQYQLDPDHRMLIAAAMTGGWTSKQVGNLLRKHGVIAEEEVEEEEEGESDGEDVMAEGEIVDLGCLETVEDEDLREIFTRLGSNAEILEQVCEEVAVMHDLPAVPSQRALYLRLRQMGLLQKKRDSNGNKKKQSQRRVGGSERNKVLIKELKALYDEHKEHPDALNQITQRLTLQLSVKQVQKLLKKHGITDGGASGGKVGLKARLVAERTQLSAAMQRHAGKPDFMALIAEELPGVVTVKQAQRLLRKHGLLEGQKKGHKETKNKGAGKLTVGTYVIPEGGLEGPVPEPNVEAVVTHLRAIQQSYVSGGQRWMSARRAAAWFLSKIDAAERLWKLTSPPHVDYSLAMTEEEDEIFFMTEFAQDLLEAAGCRNDSNDYFKIPGNCSQAWRERVRTAVRAAVEELEQEGVIPGQVASLGDTVAKSPSLDPSLPHAVLQCSFLGGDVPSDRSGGQEKKPCTVEEGSDSDDEDDDEVDDDDDGVSENSDQNEIDSDHQSVEEEEEERGYGRDEEEDRLPSYHSEKESDAESGSASEDDDENKFEAVGTLSATLKQGGGGGGGLKRRKVSKDAEKGLAPRQSKVDLQAGQKNRTRRHVGQLLKLSTKARNNVEVPLAVTKEQGVEEEEGPECQSAKRAALQELSRRRNKIVDAPLNGHGIETDFLNEDVSQAMEGIKKRRLQAVMKSVGKENTASQDEDFVLLDDY